MILHTLDVSGIGCFSDPITVGPLSSGINFLSAPNGLDKTTLLRATVLAFVEQHRAKSADILALRSWGRRLRKRKRRCISTTLGVLRRYV
jgi:hypothetical protein